MRLMPNDFARPAYSAVKTHAKELSRRALPRKDGCYTFYDLWIALRDLQRQENTVRLGLLAADVKFEALAGSVELAPGLKDEQAKRDCLFPQYQKGLRGIAKEPLAREEFDLIYALSPRLRHPSKGGVGLLDLDIEAAKRVYRRFGCLMLGQ